MKNIFLLLLLIASTLATQSQKLNNHLMATPSHVRIPGTNVFMIPPAGFVLSTNFKGFQHPDDETSMIMHTEIPGPFSAVSAGFTSERLVGAGMTLVERHGYIINEDSAYVFKVEQGANGMLFEKYILIYGNHEHTSVINAVYLKDSAALGAKMKDAIMSTVVNDLLDADPRAALDYTMDETVGNMQMVSVIGEGFLFNRDKKTPTESADSATVITAKSFNKNEISNKELFIIQRLRSLGDDFIPVEKSRPITIGSLNGLELFGKNKTGGEAYLVILYPEDGGYYLLLGMYQSGFEQAKKDVQAIIKTFKLK